MWVKNIAKLILRKGPVVWNYIVHETPTYPESIYIHLATSGISEYSILVKTMSEKIKKIKSRGALKEYKSFIFFINLPK